MNRKVKKLDDAETGFKMASSPSWGDGWGFEVSHDDNLSGYSDIALLIQMNLI